MQQAFVLPLEDSFVIRGDVHTTAGPGEKQPVLIFCHGFKGFKDWGSFPYVADTLAAKKMTVIRFNFSANGVGASLTEFDELEKFGINTYARELADLHVIMRAILDRELPLAEHFDTEQIFVMGHSKGGGDSILFGADHPDIKGIITWNGIANVNLFDESVRQEVKENGIAYMINGRTGQKMPITPEVIEDVDQNVEAYDLVKKVSQLDKSLLIVQGKKDSGRLVQGAKRLKEAYPKAILHWIHEADHVMNTRHPFTGTSAELEEAIEVTAQFVLQNTQL
ncbi:alpha/beta hydrolase [Brevibacillus laterosporus]|uniref:alpha/beta hydrolase n=1 Tax=Brevibacillus laterosporus TaxID=1465 RepID=UPI002654B9F5|nr:alpha/beta fold hydrolase [Brevibacillus laterosporus]MDN9011342.1 alpha/beta fold hydrolase [Brevibacillus laterosporus]MDO0942366.1 alpha/beta fold hydrolase [Brevibacillus laterosporus]